MSVKKLLILTILGVFFAIFAGGCAGKGDGAAFSSGKKASEEGEVQAFAVSKEASIRDFDWAFNPKSYDKSGEVSFKDPYAVSGVWEMAIWRRVDGKPGAQKDVYWVKVGLEFSEGRVLDADPDVYAYQAFLDSEYAKNAGVTGSEATKKLMEALQAGDGSIKAHVTVTLAGIEDNDGNWTAASGTPIRLEGSYYPDHMFLKAADQKGNEFTANSFLTNGDEQHAVGAYTPKTNKAGLLGAVYLCRKMNDKVD